MKKLIIILLLITLLFLDYGCKDNSTAPNDIDTTSVVDRKPNLYIYPVDTLTISVEINFPKGGEIIESIPHYKTWWNITVSPNGKIDETYNYLYYECKFPDLTQKNYGWVIQKKKLKDFFEENMSESGFNKYEIKDFIDFWIPILKDFEYYEIYPQYNKTLKNMIEITFSNKPDNFYRLHYLLIGRDDNELNLLAPEVEIAKREKYYSVEWGVLIK